MISETRQNKTKQNKSVSLEMDGNELPSVPLEITTKFGVFSNATKHAFKVNLEGNFYHQKN